MCESDCAPCGSGGASAAPGSWEIFFIFNIFFSAAIEMCNVLHRDMLNATLYFPVLSNPCLGQKYLDAKLVKVKFNVIVGTGLC